MGLLFAHPIFRRGTLSNYWAFILFLYDESYTVFIQMNKLSTHKKYILKDGKYYAQERESADNQSVTVRSQIDSNLQFLKRSSIGPQMPSSRNTHPIRPGLSVQMTTSAIYPRKSDYIPKNFTSRKTNGNDTNSVNQSLHKIQHNSKAPRLTLGTTNSRLAVEHFAIEAKSNINSDEEDQLNLTINHKEGQTRTSKIKSIEDSYADGKLLESTILNRELASKLKNQAKEESQYRLSAQQEIIWLKRMLEDRTRDLQRATNQNNAMQTQILFLKERITSLQRNNHTLQIQNTKNKLQVFTENELIQLCCPQQAVLKSESETHLNIRKLEEDMERIKAEIAKLEKQNPFSDTRSEKIPAGHYAMSQKGQGGNHDKIAQLKKHLAEKRNILEAHHLGSETKQSLKKYITNIVERSKADQIVIQQLKGEIGSKDQLIIEMDKLIVDINSQLAVFKKELARHEELENNTIRQMKMSFLTNNTVAPTPDSATPLSGSRVDHIIQSSPIRRPLKFQDQPETLQHSRLQNFTSAGRSKLTEPQESALIGRLQQECYSKQRIIQMYEAQFLRMREALETQYGEPYSVETEPPEYIQYEIDYKPQLHEVNSSLTLKQKKFGDHTRPSVIIVKRSSNN